MSEKALQLSEQALRLALALAALALAAWTANPTTQPVAKGARLSAAALPKPGLVKEW